MLDDLRECYRVLELAPGATLEDVKRSYRELVKVWHPDRFASDSKLQQKAGEKIKEINLAYEQICEISAKSMHSEPMTQNSSTGRTSNAARNPNPRPEAWASGAPSRPTVETSGGGFATVYRWCVLICCSAFACWISNGWGFIPISILALIFLFAHKSPMKR
jgi:hypothetical protein